MKHSLRGGKGARKRSAKEIPAYWVLACITLKTPYVSVIRAIVYKISGRVTNVDID